MATQGFPSLLSRRQSGSPVAKGGEIFSVDFSGKTYIVHAFDNVGDFGGSFNTYLGNNCSSESFSCGPVGSAVRVRWDSFEITSSEIQAHVLIVGGGGSGGLGSGSGGGGAGGILLNAGTWDGDVDVTQNSPLILRKGTYPIGVGVKGGLRKASVIGGENGSPSFAFNIAVNGGGSGSDPEAVGGNGGSGGGAGTYSNTRAGGDICLQQVILPNGDISVPFRDIEPFSLPPSCLFSVPIYQGNPGAFRHSSTVGGAGGGAGGAGGSSGDNRVGGPGVSFLGTIYGYGGGIGTGQPSNASFYGSGGRGNLTYAVGKDDNAHGAVLIAYEAG